MGHCQTAVAAIFLAIAGSTMARAVERPLAFVAPDGFTDATEHSATVLSKLHDGSYEVPRDARLALLAVDENGGAIRSLFGVLVYPTSQTVALPRSGQVDELVKSLAASGVRSSERERSIIQLNGVDVWRVIIEQPDQGRRVLWYAIPGADELGTIIAFYPTNDEARIRPAIEAAVAKTTGAVQPIFGAQVWRYLEGLSWSKITLALLCFGIAALKTGMDRRRHRAAVKG